MVGIYRPHFTYRYNCINAHCQLHTVYTKLKTFTLGTLSATFVTMFLLQLVTVSYLESLNARLLLCYIHVDPFLSFDTTPNPCI